MRLRELFTAGLGVRITGATAMLIGTAWLVFWFTGMAHRWSAEGVNTVKTNMALSQVLAGTALLLLAVPHGRQYAKGAGLLAAAAVFAIGVLTFSQHVFGYNLGIDQLLARESVGAVATVSPNRIGPPGSLSLALLGAGLLLLPSRWARFAPWLGVTVCATALVPAVGFAYGVAEFYSNPRLTGIAWSSVIALISLGAGLVMARPEGGPMGQLLREDAGGLLVRRRWLAVVCIPLVLGSLEVLGEHHKLFDSPAGTGMLVITLIVVFSALLWRSAAQLSRVAAARVEAEAETRSVALFPEENPGPVLRIGEDGVLLFANRASAALLAEWQCAAGRAVPDVVQKVVRRCLAAGVETELETTVGEQVLSLMVVPIQGRNYANIYGREVTERRRAVAALRESEERFRTMADGTPVVIWITDVEGRNRFVNRAYCKFFGVEANAVQDHGWQPPFHPEDRAGYLEAFLEALKRRAAFRAQARVRRHDGAWRWIESCAEPRFSAAGEFLGLAGCSSDVTERKEFQLELERLVAERTAKLQELVGELEHFSYTITHDLRAPLRAMRGFAELVNDAYQGWEHEEPKQFIRKIMTSAERMDALIRDALNYSQSVRQELPLTDVDTGALLRGMLDSYPELQPPRARIALAGKLPVVLGNEAGLTQCFSNLLGNAVKFVKPGHVPEIRVWSEEREGWARIWVEDKGIGIAKEMLPRVFDMFSRGSRDYEGTGIGLALVRKVAQRMGGRAGVESEEGSGSRFWLELKAGGIKAAAKAQGCRGSERRGAAVLYVEDEESDALFMGRAFAQRKLGSVLRVVPDGRAAIDYLSGAGQYAERKEYPLPAVVLLDLNLPQVAGFEVLRWMRNHPDFGATPVVVFSSSTREEDKLKARELGATEFVSKPKSGTEFNGVVETLRERWLCLEAQG